jgi:deoxyribonuclease IV
MSISGGLHLAFERGEEATCNIIQIFTKNATQWKTKPLADEEIEKFKSSWGKSKIKAVMAHDSYLINLASHDENVFKKSLDAFEEEMRRTEALAIPYLVMHPGSHMGKGDNFGINHVAKAFNLLIEKTPGFKMKILIETTAGQGSNIGYRFEHIRDIIDLVNDKDRVGACFDTCHVFAAGYELRNKEDYEKTFKRFDMIIGLNKLFAFHLNDSKKDLGSKVDRHEHIGKGFIGLEPFSYLLNDERFKTHPMSIETPKEDDDDMDKENLKVLRSLINQKNIV